MIPTDPTEREGLAAEYVLGSLDARDAAEVAAALPQDAALRADVEAWEARLAPLQALAPAEAPPDDLWARIEAALPGAAAPASAPGPAPGPTAEVVPLPPPRPAARPSRWLGPAWATGALAAAFAGYVLLRPAPPPQLMTVLLTQRDAPAWTVQADASGALRLAALNPRPVEGDRVLQLWALPPGATAPTSLGLIPASGQVTVTPQGVRPQPGMLIEISLEPPGGSTTGRPTGPVLFIGRLSAAGAS